MAPQGTTDSGNQGSPRGILELELPATLASALQGYLATRPQLTTSSLLQAALAQFLVQQGEARADVRELYLDGLFQSGR